MKSRKHKRIALLALVALQSLFCIGCSSLNCSASKSASGSNTESPLVELDATLLWFEDFETGNYARWTSNTYLNDWNEGLCHENGFSTDRSVSGAHSHLSKVTCAIDQSHRGYGLLQFNGDTLLDEHTNQGQGTEAPHGVVNTYWSWLDTSYPFKDGKWFSFWTVENDAAWKDDVITLGLEDESNRLTPAHIVSTGGTVKYAEGAPTFPLRQWVRTTIYINYHKGEMHIWQDGAELLSATFSRSDTDIAHWHWGAYAEKSNDDITLYEDDIAIWKLNEPLTDFSVEPLFKR